MVPTIVVSETTFLSNIRETVLLLVVYGNLSYVYLLPIQVVADKNSNSLNQERNTTCRLKLCQLNCAKQYLLIIFKFIGEQLHFEIFSLVYYLVLAC